MLQNKIDNYFFILFSIIPISIIIGSSVSLGNILLIDLSFIILLIYKKDFFFLKNKTVKLILLLYLYLIFNSIISLDFSFGAARNFGFIRWIIFFVALNYFFYKKNFINKVFIIWTISIIIIFLDVYFEVYFGKNILGFGGEEFGKRIVSFFKDEPIVGGYVNAFYLIIIGYLFFIFKNYSKIYQVAIIIISVLFVIAILLTGERSNAIKSFVAIFIFYSLFKNFSIKEKMFYFLAVLILLVGTVLSSDFLKIRYINQITGYNYNEYDLDGKKDIKKNLFTKNIFAQRHKTIYFKIYRSGINIFKDNPIFGVGNKNYRISACKIYNKKDKNYSKEFVCTTHPHQMYIEFLSEHGLVGTILLIFILYKLIFMKFKIILKSNNYIQLGCVAYLITIFVPFLPGGAFFGDFNSTLFWVNLSVMYAVNPKTNIFNN
jgi:O-antigen ligase